MMDQERQILEYTAEYYRISVNDLVSSTRRRHIARPRQCAYLLCHELLRRGWSDIARTFGGRHHVTIMDGVQAVADRKDRREQAFLAAARAHFKRQMGF